MKVTMVKKNTPLNQYKVIARNALLGFRPIFGSKIEVSRVGSSVIRTAVNTLLIVTYFNGLEQQMWFLFLKVCI